MTATFLGACSNPAALLAVSPTPDPVASSTPDPAVSPTRDAEAIAKEACALWAENWDSGDRTVAENRAVELARGASADRRFKHLATDMQTGIDASAAFAESQSYSDLSTSELEIEISQQLTEMDSMIAASEAVRDTCDVAGQALP